jgi:catechol 2,3-dioxygenase-like lactoylglutathione lyase family enzyme
MNVKFIASVSMIARDPVKSRKPYVDTLGLPLQQLEGDFYASEMSKAASTSAPGLCLGLAKPASGPPTGPPAQSCSPRTWVRL